MAISRRALLSSIPFAAARPANRPPNVVLIFADDLGYRDLGCFGATDLRTPHLDAVAASGVRLTNFYVNAPVCGPSRASLMTGRYPARAGVPTNGPSLPSSEKTIGTLLQSAGYATALTGKWHLSFTGRRPQPKSAPNAHGFDYFYGIQNGMVDYYTHAYRGVHDLWRNNAEIEEKGQYLTERITEEALGFIDEHISAPFFLYLPYTAPHGPLQVPRKYLERFPHLAGNRRTLAAMIAAMDDGIGSIVSRLESAGIRDDTVIIFLSDNGGVAKNEADNSPFRGYKFCLFEGGIRTPCIMSWPERIPSGKVVDEMSMAADILPTICQAAGVDLPADRVIDGRNLLPMLTSGAASPHEEIFWSWGPLANYPGEPGQLAMRRGKWKLTINAIPHDLSENARKAIRGEDSVFLADLENDPGETRNLRRQHPSLTEELVRRVNRWHDEITASKR